MVIFDWHALWTNLLEFGTFDHVTISLAEKIIRPIVVYVGLIIALRTVGRRILAQLNPFDLVVLLMLSNTVQNAVIGNDASLLGGIVGAAALLGVNAIAVRLFYRGPTMEHRLRESDDTYLIRHSHPDEQALGRLHINMGELTARAHERGFDDLHEVETAVLYPNGTMYMRGSAPSDSVRLDQILKELQALRQEVATLR